tara:strand:- start:975 stop:2096 length:1122 start_codon:yes stop_codon:yes gene_type:complete
MVKKKILFIVTVYRIGERIHPIIPKLYEFSDIDLLKVNEMSSDMNWYGTDDPRITFNNKYEEYFDNIFDGGSSSIEQYGARNETPCDVIKNLNINKYDLVIYDDDRNRHGVWYIFEQIKNKIPMIGNVHGNWWSSLDGFPEKNNITKSYNKSFNYVSVFGAKEKNSYEFNDFVLDGGIPSNDELKYYDRTNDFILVIVNFLGNRNMPSLYNIQVDEKFINTSGLLELQNKYHKKIVFKLKSRADHPYPQKDFDYLNSVVPKELDYEIIMDFPDHNQLICGAFLVISAPSTFALKPIQKGIPTILIKGTGTVGNFCDYRGLVELNKDIILNRVEKEISLGRDNNFIKNTINGGMNFNSTEKYIKNIRGLLSENN